MQASVSQSHEKFQYPGRQCICNSVASFIRSISRKPENWTSQDLDNILSQGDYLYGQLTQGENDYFMVNELPDIVTFDYEQYTLVIGAEMSGMIWSDLDIMPYYSLSTAFMSMSDNYDVAFVTVGDKTPFYTSALFVKAGNYFMFDPHSRDYKGMMSPDGTAILISFQSSTEVINYIRNLPLTWLE